MFGTYEPEGERVRYGLTTQLKTFKPVRVAFHEYIAMWHDMKKARGLRAKLGSSSTAPAGRRQASRKPRRRAAD